MKIVWQIEHQDIKKVQTFLGLHRSDPLVQQRFEGNLGDTKAKVLKVEFWQAMVSCLLTTRQRSGPDSAVLR
jgi:hypothetical protein